jgi:hypothetical protein
MLDQRVTERRAKRMYNIEQHANIKNPDSVPTRFVDLSRSKASQPGRRGGLIVPALAVVKAPELETASLLTAEALSLPIERLHPDFDAYTVDVRKLLDYHPHWREEIMEVAREAELATIERGAVATAMDPQDFDTHYQPTNTVGIREKLPWLEEYFAGPFQLLAQRAAKDPSLKLGKGKSALNVNYFQQEDYVGKKKISYEMHWDRNPVTALLFLITYAEKDGGALTLYEGRDAKNRPIGQKIRVQPEAGKLVIFNGNKHPHEVSIVTTGQPRGVVPGDYFTPTWQEVNDVQHDEQVGVNV